MVKLLDNETFVENFKLTIGFIIFIVAYRLLPHYGWPHEFIRLLGITAAVIIDFNWSLFIVVWWIIRRGISDWLIEEQNDKN